MNGAALRLAQLLFCVDDLFLRNFIRIKDYVGPVIVHAHGNNPCVMFSIHNQKKNSST